MESAVREGTRAFATAITAFPQEHFYVFGFYTDNDITSIYPFAHTVEAYERLDENDVYVKWAPDEWVMSFSQLAETDWMPESNKMLMPALSEYDEDESEDEFFARKIATLQTLTRALFAIRDSALFDGHRTPDGLVCFVNISDAEDDEIAMMFELVLPQLPEKTRAELRDVFGL